MSNEPFAPIIEAPPQATETIDTLDKLSHIGVARAVKSGAITPEAAVKMHEAEWAKKQGRQFTLPSMEARVGDYKRACKERELFQSRKQPFMFEGFTKAGDFYLSQGLTLVGARSGHSKSTTASNILAGFLTYRPDTIAIVLSNEENTDAIIHRTACVLLKKAYMAYHAGALDSKSIQDIRATALWILNRVVVVNDPVWDTTCLENVQGILESAATNGDMVLIDYYQTINHSRDYPELEPFQVLKKFGSYMREYGRRSKVPVVVFCQLNPKSAAGEFQARIQNDKTIYNDAFNAVEIEPDFETCLTTFTVHKQRFGTSQGTKVVLKYESGRYEQEQSL